MMRRSMFGLFVFFLIFPYVILIFHLKDWGFIDIKEYGIVFLRSCAHSATTAGVSVVLGYWGACGLIAINKKHRKIFEFIYTLPNFVPSLFVILSCLNLFKPFPFGFWGIVIVQTIMNVGLASVLILKLFEENLGSYIEHSIIDGAHAAQIHNTIIPLLKPDLLLIFLLIFSFCFSGFAIPTMVGLGAPWTIEVLIYEKLKTIASWPEALTLSAMQSVIIFLFVIFLPKPQFLRQDFTRYIGALQNKYGIMAPVLCTFIIFLGSVLGLSTGVDQFNQLSKLNLVSQSMGTLLIGLMTGTFTFFILNLFLYICPSEKVRELLLTYAPPSLVLTGFVFLISSSVFIFLKISLGLTLLMFPIVYKMKWYSQIQKIKNQKIMAESLGARPFHIFKCILYPQCAKTSLFLSGVVAFWVAGDFAFSRIIAGQDVSVALLIQGLVSNYRLELASLLIWWMLILGLVCYLFFVGLYYVFSKKSFS